jgi:hypothetical protein
MVSRVSVWLGPGVPAREKHFYLCYALQLSPRTFELVPRC